MQRPLWLSLAPLPRLTQFAPYAVGGLLLVAAGLKAHQLLTAPLASDGLFSSRWFRVGLIDAEIVLGLALFLGVARPVVRRLCLLLFIGFFTYSVYQELCGVKSCACLGRVQLRSAAMALIDAAAFTALWLWKPLPIPSNRYFHQGMVCACIICLASGSGAFTSGQVSPLVSATPALVDLGILVQGEKAQFSVVLQNNLDNTLSIEELTSSCPCLICSESPFVLAPRAARVVEFELNLAKAPIFTGHFRST